MEKSQSLTPNKQKRNPKAFGFTILARRLCLFGNRTIVTLKITHVKYLMICRLRFSLLFCLFGWINLSFSQDYLDCKDSYSVTSIQFICLNCAGENISIKYYSCDKQDSIVLVNSVGMDATPEYIIETKVGDVTKVQLLQPFQTSILIPSRHDYNYIWINREKVINQESTNDARINLH